MRTKLLEWIRRVDLAILLTCLCVTAGVWAFIAIAEEVVEGDTLALDKAILMRLRDAADPSDPIGPKWLEEAVRDLTALGSTAVLAIVIGVAVGYLVMRNKIAAMILLLVSSVGGMVISHFLKTWFARPRPGPTFQAAYVVTQSFPSGHSMLSAVVYLTVGALLSRLVEENHLKAYILGVAVSISFVVGLSRLYLGVHYPTDVLAGWVLGLSWALLCWGATRYLQKRHTVEGPAEAG